MVSKIEQAAVKDSHSMWPMFIMLNNSLTGKDSHSTRVENFINRTASSVYVYGGWEIRLKPWVFLSVLLSCKIAKKANVVLLLIYQFRIPANVSYKLVLYESFLSWGKKLHLHVPHDWKKIQTKTYTICNLHQSGYTVKRQERITIFYSIKALNGKIGFIQNWKEPHKNSLSELSVLFMKFPTRILCSLCS